MKSKGLLFAISLVFLLCSLVPVYANRDDAMAQAAYRTERSSLLFTPNKGQLVDTKGERRPDILFFTQSEQANVYFSRGVIHYVFQHLEEFPSTEKPASVREPFAQEQRLAWGYPLRFPTS